eukprot:SAG22_NODE_605_length_8616_cov_14.093578_5_plen_118_part_00
MRARVPRARARAFCCAAAYYYSIERVLFPPEASAYEVMPRAGAGAPDDEVRIDNPMQSAAAQNATPAIGLPDVEGGPEGDGPDIDVSTWFGRVEEGMPRWFDWQISFLGFSTTREGT